MLKADLARLDQYLQDLAKEFESKGKLIII
jgi:hypothetical protein